MAAATIKITVDTTELDDALRKVDLLLQKQQQIHTGVSGAAAIAAGVAVAIAAPKRFTRRSLFTLGVGHE